MLCYSRPAHVNIMNLINNNKCHMSVKYSTVSIHTIVSCVCMPLKETNKKKKEKGKSRLLRGFITDSTQT